MPGRGPQAVSPDPTPSLRTAIVGVVALAPAILFAVANILRWELDVRAVSEIAGPIVNGGSGLRELFETWALLGPIVALLVTLPDTVSIRRAPGTSIGLEIRVAPSAFHIVVIVASIVVLAVFAGYFVSEAMATPPAD